MVKIADVIFRGASGKLYPFEVYRYNSILSRIAAVYSITERFGDIGTSGFHSHIYIGQTENLRDHFESHQKTHCFNSNNANCICIYREDDEQTRFRIENDLLINYNPTCS